MMPSPYEFRDYREYLLAVERSKPKRGFGFRTQLARALRCQNAYISRILKGGADLSPEQADDAADFLGLNEEERDYFFILLQKARAGTTRLKNFFDRKAAKIAHEKQLVRNRMPKAMPLSGEDQILYFSHWLYAAVHVLISVPELRSRKALSKHLKIPQSRVAEVLGFLIRCQLVEGEDGYYRPGKTRIHLGGDSPLVSRHHTNWRNRAVVSLDGEIDCDLHYSSIVSLSHEDLTQIKGILLNSIEKVNEVVKPSKDETAVAVTLDVFFI